MPKDVEIVRMGIMLVKPDPASTGCIGPSYDGIWPGEDWTPVDEIRFTDTIVCDDAIRMDDETLWESDEITITEMGEFLNPWCMMDDKAVELDCTFNKAPFGRTATLYREFEDGDPGRRLYGSACTIPAIPILPPSLGIRRGLSPMTRTGTKLIWVTAPLGIAGI